MTLAIASGILSRNDSVKFDGNILQGILQGNSTLQELGHWVILQEMAVVKNRITPKWVAVNGNMDQNLRLALALKF